MTVKIKLSSLTIAPEEFARCVESHCERMREYASHLEGVKNDAANETLKPEDKRVAFPPPSADPLVEQAAIEGYEFEGPTLEEKKAALVADVRKFETDAIELVFPLAKRRHWEFREADIREADQKRLIEHPARVDDVEAFHNDLRDAEDTSFLAKQAQRKQAVAQVQRAAAKHEHDIADLTDETVDTYVIGGTFA